MAAHGRTTELKLTSELLRKFPGTGASAAGSRDAVQGTVGLYSAPVGCQPP
jgi:hypothetical protein